MVKILQVKAAQFLKYSGHEGKEGTGDFVNTFKFNIFLRSDIAFELRKLGMTDFIEAINRTKNFESAMMAISVNVNYIADKNKSKQNDR